LVAEFCERNGIHSQHIGPIVYYSGFTRKFLDGETESTEVLLEKVKAAVDKIAEGVRVCVIDGVGYPAVGSICGIDNGVIARSIGAAVILVAKAGVGDAIDSFNLDANWFISHGVPVLGAIYNRFKTSGYYSLKNCCKYLEKFFASQRERGRPHYIYGYIPELVKTQDDIASSKDETTSPDKHDVSSFVQRLITQVHVNINVTKLIADAADATDNLKPEKIISTLKTTETHEQSQTTHKVADSFSNNENGESQKQNLTDLDFDFSNFDTNPDTS
jgi:hypothetical protein